MNTFNNSKNKCWGIFKKYYPNYISWIEEQKYIELIKRNINSKMIVLDAGCGRSFKYKEKLQDEVGKIYGIDLVTFDCNKDLLNGSLYHLPFKNQSIDLIISRSVFEHLEYPDLVFQEFYRILTANGKVIFLTPNRYDYVSLMSRCIPNRLHSIILNRMLGRKEESVFNTYFRINTSKDILAISNNIGFKVNYYEYISQYPNYLMFNAILFRLGIVYDKLISKYEALGFLRPWILCGLIKNK